MSDGELTNRTLGLEVLDRVLVEVRRAIQRPGYRQRLSKALDLNLDGTLRALRSVERNQDRHVSVGDIAIDLTIDPSTASRMVDRCVESGYLTRHPSELDRRRTQLKLTAAGRALLSEASAARMALLAEVTESWPAEDLVQLGDLLHRLLDGFARLEVEDK